LYFQRYWLGISPLGTSTEIGPRVLDSKTIYWAVENYEETQRLLLLNYLAFVNMIKSLEYDFNFDNFMAGITVHLPQSRIVG
jgi:hypothetical protein